MTSRVDLVRWFVEGKKDDANTHMLVVLDSFDHSDYPVYAQGRQDCLEKNAKFSTSSMQRVLEVYDLRLSMGLQMEQGRVWNLPDSEAEKV